jgi:hypothetical protein
LIQVRSFFLFINRSIVGLIKYILKGCTIRKTKEQARA